MSFDHTDEYEFTTSNTSFKPFAAIKHNGFTIPANSKITVKLYAFRYAINPADEMNVR